MGHRSEGASLQRRISKPETRSKIVPEWLCLQIDDDSEALVKFLLKLERLHIRRYFTGSFKFQIHASLRQLQDIQKHARAAFASNASSAQHISGTCEQESRWELPKQQSCRDEEPTQGAPTQTNRDY